MTLSYAVIRIDSVFLLRFLKSCPRFLETNLSSWSLEVFIWLFSYLSLIEIILRWGFSIWELIFILSSSFVLILVGFFCVLFLFLLRFGQISPLTFFRWFLPWPRIGMMSLVTVSPVITAFHSYCRSHHVFDQVNLWPAWVGFETAIFWGYGYKTHHSYPRSQ